MSLVLESTIADSNGEIDTLPVSDEWIDEWNAFQIEIWITVPNAEHFGVADAVTDLIYNTQYFTATQVEFGAGFTINQTFNIDDAAGRISNIAASTSSPEVGDGRPALFARIRFESSGTDNVLFNTDGQYVQPVIDLGFGIENLTATAASIGAVNLQISAIPTVELWPVLYDFNNNGSIDFADFSVFAGTFRTTVDVNGPSEAWASDFNFDGEVNFADFSVFSANFRNFRGSGIPRVYQDDYPGQLNNLLLQPESGVSYENVNQLSSAELQPIVEEAIQRLVQVYGNEVEPTLTAVEFQIADLPGQTLGRAGSTTIVIDQDAAGAGWFIDASPSDDIEYHRDDDDSMTLLANAMTLAAHRVDLLSVVMHELSHRLGLQHSGQNASLMDESLPVGVRRLPGNQLVSGVADDDSVLSLELKTDDLTDFFSSLVDSKSEAALLLDSF
ncbi:MAG: matrixin family metalloprotease [Gammaproteobacteria bacterium]